MDDETIHGLPNRTSVRGAYLEGVPSRKRTKPRNLKGGEKAVVPVTSAVVAVSNAVVADTVSNAVVPVSNALVPVTSDVVPVESIPTISEDVDSQPQRGPSRSSKITTIPMSLVEDFMKRLVNVEQAVNNKDAESQIVALREQVSSGANNLEMVVREGIAAIGQRDNQIAEYENFTLGLVQNIKQLAYENSKIQSENTTLQATLNEVRPIVDNLRRENATRAELVSRIGQLMQMQDFNTLEDLLNAIYANLLKRLEIFNNAKTYRENIELTVKQVADTTGIPTDGSDTAFTVIDKFKSRIIVDGRTIAEAEIVNSRLNDEKNKLQRELEKASEENRVLLDEQSEAKSNAELANADLNNAVVQLRQRNDELRSRIDSLTRDGDDSIASIQKENNALVDEVRSLKTSLSLKTTELKDYDGLVQSLQAKIEKLEPARDEREIRIKELRLENSKLVKQLEESRDQFDNNNRQLVAVTEKMTSARATIAELENAKAIMAAAPNYEQEVNDLRAKIDTMNKVIEAQKLDVEQITRINGQISKQLREAREARESAVAQMTSENKELERRLNIALKSSADENSKLKGLNESLANATLENNRLKSKLNVALENEKAISEVSAAHEVQIKILRGRAESLESEITKYREEATSLRKENSKLSAQLAEIKSKLDENAQALVVADQRGSEIDRLRSENQSLKIQTKGQLRAIASSKNERTNEIAKLTMENAQLSGELQSLVATTDVRNNEIAKLKSENLQLDVQLQEARSQLVEIATLSSANAQLQEQLVAANVRNSEIASANAQLQEQLVVANVRNSEIATLSSANSQLQEQLVVANVRNSEIATLNEQLDAQLVAANVRNNEIATLSSANSQLDTQLQEARAQLVVANVRNSEIATLNEQLDAQLVLVNARNSEIATLTRENAHLTRQLQEYRAQLDDSAKAIMDSHDRRDNEIAILTSENEQLNNELQELRAQSAKAIMDSHDHRDNEIAVLTSENEELNRQLQEVRAQLDNSTKAIMDSRNQTENEIAILRSENEELNRQLQETRAQLDEDSKAIVVSHDQRDNVIARLTRENEQLSMELRDVDYLFPLLKETTAVSCSFCTASITSLENARSALIAAQEERENEIAILTNENRQLTIELEEAVNAIMTSSPEQIESISSEMEKREKEIIRLTSENSKLFNQVQELKTRLDETNLQLVDATYEINTGRETITALEEQVKSQPEVELPAKRFKPSIEGTSCDDSSMDITFRGIGIDEFIDERLVSVANNSIIPDIEFPGMSVNGNVVDLVKLDMNRYGLLQRIHPPGAVYLPELKQLLLGGSFAPGLFQRIPISVQFNPNGLLIDGVTSKYDQTYNCAICKKQLKHLELARQHLTIHAGLPVVVDV